MFRTVFSIFARHHDFTAAELGAAEENLPKGWTLDKGACTCGPTAAGGWQATLVVVCRAGGVVRVVSGVQADPTNARHEAMEKLPGSVQSFQGGDAIAIAGRLTSLAAEPAPPPGLRPSAIISLRDSARRGDR